MVCAWVRRPARSIFGRTGPVSTPSQGSGSLSCGRRSLKTFYTVTSTFWHSSQHLPPQHQSPPYLPTYAPRRSSTPDFHPRFSKHLPRPGSSTVEPGFSIPSGPVAGDQARIPPDFAALAAPQRGRARILATNRALEGSETVAPSSGSPQEVMHGTHVVGNPVSYTHLTLPTKRIV